MEHQINFGEDYTKRKRAGPHYNVCTHIYALCTHAFTQNFTKIVLIVHYYDMTLSLKFHKDPSFCCGGICKISLNLHKCKCEVPRHAHFRFVFFWCPLHFYELLFQIYEYPSSIVEILVKCCGAFFCAASEEWGTL